MGFIQLCRLLSGFGKFCGNKLFIWNMFGQFPGFVKDILQQGKSIFFKDEIISKYPVRSIWLRLR